MKQNKLLMILGIACAVCVVAMVIILGVTSVPKRGEFTPPPFDPSATVGTPTVPDGLGWGEIAPEGGSFSISLCGVVKQENGKADIWLTNPSKNNVLIKVRILDAEGNILGETGLVRPGEYVQSVTIADPLAAGTQIVMKVMSYQPDTYYSEGSFQLKTVIS